jgi:hypothetical protein
LHKKTFYNYCSSPNIVKAVKLRSACKISVENLQTKRTFGSGMTECKEDVRTNFKETCEHVDWIQLAQNGDKWRTPVFIFWWNIAFPKGLVISSPSKTFLKRTSQAVHKLTDYVLPHMICTSVYREGKTGNSCLGWLNSSSPKPVHWFRSQNWRPELSAIHMLISNQNINMYKQQYNKSLLANFQSFWLNN